jgi:hypothetical protein
VTAPQPRWLGPALLALAGGLTTIALLGPLALGLISYRYSPTMLNQAIGLPGPTDLSASRSCAWSSGSG